MSSLKRLFIIKNATHLEVVHIFLKQRPLSENFIILTLDRLAGNKELINVLKNDDKLKLLDIYVLKSVNSYLQQLKVITNILKAKKLDKYEIFFDEVIFSNYKTWFQHFLLNKLNTTRIILLSDGVGILEVPLFRKNGNELPLERLPFKGNKILCNKILNLKPITHLHYFSQVDMEIEDTDTLEVFQYAKGAKKKVLLDKIYFIGSPLVELNYLNQDSYIASLNEILAKYRSKKIIYFAHRKEENRNLKSYEFFGKINTNIKPFEKFLEEDNTLPSVVISHISSVLINLSPIYPEINFKYMPIKLEDIKDPKFLERYKTALEGFENIKENNFEAW